MTAPTAEPIDLRLVLVAGAGWLATLLCLDRSPVTIVLLAAGGGVLAALALTLGRRLRSGAAVAAVGAGVVLVLLPLAARIEHARQSPLVQLANRHAGVELQLTLDSDPAPIASTGFGGLPRVAADASAVAVSVDGRRGAVTGRVIVLAPAAGWTDLLPGQRVVAAGSLAPARDDQTAVVLFVDDSPQLLGAPPWWQRTAGAVRVDLRAASAGLPSDVAGLLPGLVDGDTSRLDPVLADNFRLAGLTHLVAVSGTNCSIVVGVVLLLLTRAGVRPSVRAVVGGVVLVAFVVVARPSPSVLRAAVMAAVAMVALAAGRPRAAVPALAATSLALLLWDPWLARDYGFVMSSLATGALLVIAPGWASWLRDHRVPAVLAESVAVATAAHLVTAPVIACLSGRVSLVAIPANVLAEPVVAPATVLGFLAAALAPLSLGAAHGLLWLAAWPGRWLVWVADTFGGLRGSVLPWPDGVVGGLALAAVLAAMAWAGRRRLGRAALGAALLVALVVQFPGRTVLAGWPPPGWLMVMCDVGQGDGLVLNARPHAAVVVDSGPDPVPMDRCLHALGVTDVPLLVITHFHADHVGGLDGVVHGRHVGRIVAGPLPEPVYGVDAATTIARRLGLTITTPPVGSVFVAGGVRLDVLGPQQVLHDTHSDPNNDSLVTRATIDGTRILLPGDAEIEEQAELLAAGADLRADVLKVAHHGSAYFEPAFLAAAHARAALISVGAHNDYGHPSPRLLDALAHLGVPTWRTDHDGDIAVARTATGLQVVTHPSAPGLAAGAPLRTAAVTDAVHDPRRSRPRPAHERFIGWRRADPGGDPRVPRPPRPLPERAVGCRGPPQPAGAMDPGGRRPGGHRRGAAAAERRRPARPRSRRGRTGARRAVGRGRAAPRRPAVDLVRAADGRTVGGDR